MKTRIAFFFFAGKYSGGTFQYSITMLRAILQSDELITTVFYTNDDFLDYVDGNKIEKFKIKQGPFLKIFRSFFSVRSKYYDDFDIVFSPTYDPLLLGFENKFIFTLHDLQEKYFPENFSFLQRFWRNTLYQKLSKVAKAVICESNFVKKDIQRYYPTYKNIYVLEAPQMLKSTDIVKTNLYPGLKYFFYPAYFKQHKNHVNLIKAFALFLKDYPDYYLVLTGEKKYLYPEIEALSKDLSVFHKIIFAGRIDDESLINTYSYATALVMPSLFESISIPILEAFQLGVPVCSSNVYGLTEQVSGFGYLFDPNNPIEIAEQMKILVEDEEQTQELRARALAHSRDINDIEKYSSKIKNIINNEI